MLDYSGHFEKTIFIYLFFFNSALKGTKAFQEKCSLPFCALAINVLPDLRCLVLCLESLVYWPVRKILCGLCHLKGIHINVFDVQSITSLSIQASLREICYNRSKSIRGLYHLNCLCVCLYNINFIFWTILFGGEYTS